MAKRLGFSEDDFQSLPYAQFYKPIMAPLQEQVQTALTNGPIAQELLPPVTEAYRLLADGYQQIETGYTRTPDWGIRVACLTKMPKVKPEMWDWWFGWHGCEDARYKLWHPQAHVSARWADGKSEEAYLGRTSLVSEYFGSTCQNAAISFIPPRDLGLAENRLAAKGQVAICARVAEPGIPIKGGWLIHQIRPVKGGSEMRTRMWFGGENLSTGTKVSPAMKQLMRPFRPLARVLMPDVRDLLAHIGQEMNHLAGILPDIYKAFGPKSSGGPK